MRNNRLWQLSLAFLMTIVLSAVFYFTRLSISNSADRISYVAIVSALAALWVIPNLCVVLNWKVHLGKCFSSMLFILFQIVFWINLMLILFHIPSRDVRFFCNIVVMAFGILLALLCLRFELKPKSGKPTYEEVKNIKQALLELQITKAIISDLLDDNSGQIIQIENNLQSLLVDRRTIVHGIDENILNESLLIRNYALCKDIDAVRYHFALLEQLVIIAKQKI